MNNQDILKMIYLLREKAERNKLVVFVGAGVSRNVPEMPSWSELINAMATSIGYSKCKVCRHKKNCTKRCDSCSQKETCDKKCFLSNDFSTDEYLKIPQYVFNEKQKTYWEVLKSNIPDKREPDAPLSKAIFELNPSHIITTNYDKLLECSNSEFRRQYDVIIFDKDLLDADKGKYIIKMHGDVLYPQTIVLKEQDYLEYSQTHVLIELFVKALLADHTILFLGYSLNDYNIKLIISWINFLRSQNNGITKRRKIGYIVLDQEIIDKDTTEYFRNNNLEVLNIRTLPQIKSMPSSLADEKGKRLFSFLRIIKDPSLEEGVSSKMSIKRAASLLTEYKVFDYTVLLKYLSISPYEKSNSQLRIIKKDQYDRLITFIKNGTKTAEDLLQLFANSGITTIFHSGFQENDAYSIESSHTNELMTNPLFLSYIQNEYNKLISSEGDSSCRIDSLFYKHFAIGYDDAESELSRITFNELPEYEKVSFLHDREALRALNNRNQRFDTSIIEQYIANISSKSERELFQPFLDIYEGNPQKRLTMHESLDKLKENIKASSTTLFSNGSIAEIYRIKNIAINQYYFYFSRHVFILGYSDAASFFRPYIEAIICANWDVVENVTNVLELEIRNKKYPVSAIDFDIMSKFISTKNLYKLISSEQSLQFCVNESTKKHVITCAINLIDSIIHYHTYGHMNSSITTLVNLFLLITKIELNDCDKTSLASSIHQLFSNNDFNQRFWSIRCPDYEYCIIVFASFLEYLPQKTDFNCIRSIISSPDFYTCIVNSRFNSSKKIIRHFISEEDYDDYQQEISQIIDYPQDFHKKVLLLRLFYKTITSKQLKTQYKSFLAENYALLNENAIYDFVFSGWLELSSNDINTLLSEVVSLYKNKNDAVRVSPDPLARKLELVIILYLYGSIDDISSLQDLANDYPHLQFLLTPKEFDYSKVDFSNYMWVNFARKMEYMQLFKEHSDQIIPMIKEHIRIGIASEEEKKILYRYLYNENEIWKMY